MLCILDGAVMDAEDAHVSILDEGLLRGDGVFEVVRDLRGPPFALDEHLERMVRSAAVAPPAVRRARRARRRAALLEAGGPEDAALRLVVTRGGRRIGILHPLATFPETISLATIAYAPTRVLDGVKSLSYGANMLATRLAKEAGADEALLASPHGRVLEGPTTSFFYVLDGKLHTPPLSDRILDSISRRVLLAVTDASERVTTLDDLTQISEAFLASSLREVQPVRSIDGRAIPAAPGPVSVGRRRARARAHRRLALKIVTVIGNRPQFVKAAAVSGPLRAEHEEILVHTGQHYDDELSTIFVTELGVPRPEVQLGLGGGSNTEQTSRMLSALGDLLRESAPDAVLVYGDTNSTLAGALAAAQLQIPLAHVEAGMRSFDRAMPEEINRVLTDHLGDLLLVPSEAAAANLAREGVSGEVENVGDVMVDVAALVAPRARADDGPLLAAGVAAGEYLPRDGAPRGQRRRPGAPGAARRAAAVARRPGRAAAAPAHARSARGRGPARSPRGGHDRAAAARLPRLHVAADARARRADGLRRRAEGGLPRGRAVRDAARHDGVGRDGAGGLEHARRPRRRRGRATPRSRPDARRRRGAQLYGDGHAAAAGRGGDG